MGLALVAPMTIVLHGCGGDGTSTLAPSPGPGPTPAPSPTPPGPTPGPSPNPPTPWDQATAVKTLNAMYMDFDETNDESRMGVTISMAGQTNSFDANLFCSPLVNTSCYNGQADCRMSSTLFNHKVVVAGNLFAPTMDRPVGYVFNQEMVEGTFGKCSYVWDGNNFNDLNVGCGTGASGANSCDNPHSAFYDLCSDDDYVTNHSCIRTDFQVEGRMCKGPPGATADDATYGVVDPPATALDATCFYELPALIFGNSTTTSHLRDGLKQRIALQGENVNLTSTWNEVVIDNRLLIPKLISEPANTILAFVCVPSESQPTACALAETMRDGFQQAYGVTGIPVVAISKTVNFTASGGPFVVPQTSRLVSV